MALNNLPLHGLALDLAINRCPLTVAPDTLLVDVGALIGQVHGSDGTLLGLTRLRYPTSTCVLVVEGSRLAGIFTTDVLRFQSLSGIRTPTPAPTYIIPHSALSFDLHPNENRHSWGGAGEQGSGGAQEHRSIPPAPQHPSPPAPLPPSPSAPQAPPALWEREEKYRLLFESSPDSIILADKDGTIYDCNRATMATLGKSSEEIIGRSFTELGMLREEDIPKCLEILSRVVSGEVVKPFELQIVGSNTSKRWIEVLPVLLRTPDKAIAIQVVSRDVTDRVLTLEELQVHSLSDCAPHPYCSNFRATGAELIGRSVGALTPRPPLIPDDKLQASDRGIFDYKGQIQGVLGASGVGAMGRAQTHIHREEVFPKRIVGVQNVSYIPISEQQILENEATNLSSGAFPGRKEVQKSEGRDIQAGGCGGERSEANPPTEQSSYTCDRGVGAAGSPRSRRSPRPPQILAENVPDSGDRANISKLRYTNSKGKTPDTGHQTPDTPDAHSGTKSVAGQVQKVLDNSKYQKIQTKDSTVFSGEKGSEEITETYKDGQKRHFEVDYIPRVGEAGDVAGGFVLMEDSAKDLRKQAEFGWHQAKDSLKIRVASPMRSRSKSFNKTTDSRNGSSKSFRQKTRMCNASHCGSLSHPPCTAAWQLAAVPQRFHLNQLQRTQETLAKRERYLGSLVEVQRRLLAEACKVSYIPISEQPILESVVQKSVTNACRGLYDEILKLLGPAAGASRVHIFENHKDPSGELLMSQRAEWCSPGVSPEIHNPTLQNLSYKDFFPRWAEVLPKGDIIAGVLADFPLSERQILEPLGILSILILPLIVEGQFFGFIGFDNCTEARQWEPSEVDLLQGAATAVSLQQERARASEQLRSSEERFRQLAENIHQVFWITSIESNSFACETQLIYVSPAYEKIWGRSCESMYSQPNSWLDSIHPADRDRVLRSKAEREKTEGFEEEYRIVRPDGLVRWVWTRAFPIRNESGEVYRVAGIAEDITRQKLAEAEIRTALVKERELNEFKSRFITTASHEFRTPLTTILSSAELLEYYGSRWAEEKKLQHIRRIQTASDHMTQLLNDVLIIGKADAGKMHFSPTPVDLAALCRAITEEMQLGTQSKTITFASFFEPPFSTSDSHVLRGSFESEVSPPLTRGGSDTGKAGYPTVYMDETLLRYILTNLLSNAIKFSPDGGNIRFELFWEESKVQSRESGVGSPDSPFGSTRILNTDARIKTDIQSVHSCPNPCGATQHSSQVAIFQIQDCGIGIPKAEQGQLFTGFYRCSNSEHFPGNGLGLAIVKKCVDLHGGEITVESEVGVGTTFTVKLPEAPPLRNM